MKVDTPAGILKVRRAGRGESAVLLLHPLALTGELWAPYVELLARGCTVLAPDARGHGESQWDDRPFTIDHLADDAAAVIRANDSGPVGVLGMSMGGCTAISLAARNPELVDRLVLADTTSCYGLDRVRQWADRARAAVAKPRIEQVPFQLARWFSDEFRADHPEAVQRVVEIFMATSSDVHAAACLALGAFDASGDLSRIQAPSLILVGEDDRATPPSMAEAISSGIPRARLDVVPHTRHFSLIERADVWLQVEEHLRGG